MTSEIEDAAPTLSFEVVRALEEHGRLVMLWRNDPAALAASFHRQPKTWETFWPEFVGQAFPNEKCLLVGEQGDDADRAISHVWVSHNRLDFIDNDACLRGIDVSLSKAVFHDQVDKRRGRRSRGEGEEDEEE